VTQRAILFVRSSFASWLLIESVPYLLAFPHQGIVVSFAILDLAMVSHHPSPPTQLRGQSAFSAT
jgi:hypothetical protein